MLHYWSTVVKIYCDYYKRNRKCDLLALKHIGVNVTTAKPVKIIQRR